MNMKTGKEIQELLSKPLSIDEIDFRVQSINKGGYATILAYKDARVDMNRLDEAVGVLGWQRKHHMVNNVMYCSIGIYDNENNQWVWKEDAGTESYTEKEKGQASDSFKRAGFNVGIGRELYDYPIISIKLKDNEFKIENGKAKQTFDLKIRDWKWKSEFKDGKLVALSCVDNHGVKRWSFPSNSSTKPTPKPTPQPTQVQKPKPTTTKSEGGLLTDKRFNDALTLYKAGEIKKEQITAYDLTDTQKKELDAAKVNKK